MNTDTRVRRVLCAAAACALLACLQGCQDNGTHLAYAMEGAARSMRTSGAVETVVHYRTLDRASQPYYVEITPSLPDGAERQGTWGSYLVVSGKTSGGTSYHNRFMFVPKRLYVRKEHGGTTDIVLRRDGDRISVVDAR